MARAFERFVIVLYLGVERGFVPRDPGFEVGEVESGARDSPCEMIAVIPAAHAAVPDQTRDLVEEGEAAAASHRGNTEPCQAVDVRLLLRNPPVREILHDRIGLRPAESEPERIGNALHVAHEIGRPERVHALEEAFDAHGDWQHDARMHDEIELLGPRAQARRGEVRVRTAKRPVNVDFEGHASPARFR